MNIKIEEFMDLIKCKTDLECHPENPAPVIKLLTKIIDDVAKRYDAGFEELKKAAGIE